MKIDEAIKYVREKGEVNFSEDHLNYLLVSEKINLYIIYSGLCITPTNKEIAKNPEEIPDDRNYFQRGMIEGVFKSIIPNDLNSIKVLNSASSNIPNFEVSEIFSYVIIDIEEINEVKNAINTKVNSELMAWNYQVRTWSSQYFKGQTEIDIGSYIIPCEEFTSYIEDGKIKVYSPSKNFNLNDFSLSKIEIDDIVDSKRDTDTSELDKNTYLTKISKLENEIKDLKKTLPNNSPAVVAEIIATLLIEGDIEKKIASNKYYREIAPYLNNKASLLGFKLRQDTIKRWVDKALKQLETMKKNEK